MDLKGSRCERLNDKHLMPVLGLGTYAHEDVPKSKAYEATKVAIDVGYRHIDAAYFYQNEEEVGAAIRKKIANGTVRRKDLFYTTKIFEFELTPEDMNIIDGINRDFCYFYLDFAKEHPNYPFVDEK